MVGKVVQQAQKTVDHPDKGTALLAGITLRRFPYICGPNTSNYIFKV